MKAVAQKLVQFYNKFEEYLLITSLIVAVIIVFVGIVMRAVVSNSLPWSEELCRYIFVWQCWLGASLAVREGKHIRVDFIFSLLKGKAVHVAELVAAIIWFLFCVFVVYNSVELLSSIVRSGQFSPVMRMPMLYPYLSVPIGVGMMGLRLIGNIKGEIQAIMAPAAKKGVE